jgi:hypothetical protein
MKKKMIYFSAVLGIAAIAAVNVCLGSQKNVFSFSLNEIEALASEQVCLNNPGSNTGTCKSNVGTTGSSCVKAGTWDTKDCFGVTTVN